MMNNEPVAWLIQAKTWHEFTFDKPSEDNENEAIEVEPLYTHPAPTKVKFASDSCESEWIYLENAHPVKELTQGEILAIWASGNYYELDTDGTVSSVNFESFARAILRKAQEK